MHFHVLVISLKITARRALNWNLKDLQFTSCFPTNLYAVSLKLLVPPAAAEPFIHSFHTIQSTGSPAYTGSENCKGVTAWSILSWSLPHTPTFTLYHGGVRQVFKSVHI